MVELLAPVGNIEAFYAAIENKADAIYLGGKQFGARAYANNFSLDQLKEMIDYAHLFGVKVYVTVNTIVYDREFEELTKFLDFLYLNNCDAVIIQDLGVLNLISHRYPDFEIHASTQMNVQSVEEAILLKDLGVKRIVVAREIDINQIRKIKEATNLEIEVFVHGALCVSCSGNCYMSSIIGKRSGNRGRCAQPCRLPYTLDNENGYLISPKDLYSLPRIKELIEAGIDSFKIEGRMKRPEYVAQITNSYRKAIDGDFDEAEEELNLRKIFNRDFTKGFLFNEEDKDFINKEASNHQGILIGKVVFNRNNQVKIKLNYPLSKNDSIRLVGSTTDAITINQMYKNGVLIQDAKSGDVISLRSHIDGLMGADVYLTTSYSQISKLEKSYKEKLRKLLINGVVDLFNNKIRLRLEYKDYYIEKLSDVEVEEPKTVGTNDRIITQVSKLKDTVFEFENLTININKPIFINIKAINDLRRNAIDELTRKIINKYPNRKICNTYNLKVKDLKENAPKMIVKVRTLEQLQVALNYNLEVLYITDLSLLSYIKDKNIDVYYVEPRAGIEREKYPINVVASRLGRYLDFRTSIYMNTTNALAVNLLENLNATSIGISLEMSIDQIEELVYNYKKLFHRNPNLEVNVYGRYELMMLKYNLGLNKEDLDGRKSLVDRKDYNFPLLLEAGYVKVLNSKKLHLIDYLDKLKALNISPIIDFSIETKEEVEEVLDIYFNNSQKKLIDVTICHINEGVL